ncbi:ras guanine nucleotide exchange factor domain-containing protein [Mycena polygramma]|nr:ras guanine nucleotide exchange factor domain-containing protein [Mycena polygramma]
MVDPDGSVRAGTLPALIEHLTAHDKQDPAFFRRFLTTFKSFTTVGQLFDLLVQRFRIQPPWNLTQEEREEWYKLMQVVQIRVLNTFKHMVLEDDVLEKDELYILDRMKEFLVTEEGARFAVGKQLSILIQRRQLQGGSVNISVAREQMPPPPLVPKSSHDLRLLDIEPIELARQLTIMESQMYQRITPVDCLQRAREQRADNIDNITIVIQTSNKIALWIAESILSKGDLRRRVRAIERIISVADHCRRLTNFSTMTSIIAGLNTPPIRRLKRTWAQVSKRYLAQFDVCERLVSSRKGFLEYRTLIKSAHPPWLPFFGIFLSTLQFIHEGHQDNIPMPGVVDATLINFLKRQRLSDVITDLKRWQVPFNLEVVPSIQAYIDKSLSSVGDTQESTERFWATSLDLEPRDTEDEKMARLLLESGFL